MRTSGTRPDRDTDVDTETGNDDDEGPRLDIHLVLPQAMLTVEAIHKYDIHKYEDHKNVDGALLGKPKAELEPKKWDGVEPVNKENPCPERDQEPDG